MWKLILLFLSVARAAEWWEGGNLYQIYPRLVQLHRSKFCNLKVTKNKKVMTFCEQFSSLNNFRWFIQFRHKF
jgi:hypothetical protein